MKPFRFAEHRDRLRKVLVIELLGLGDNVHLLPALYLLRAALPDAELHVMSRAHVADLFVATPWVNRVWRYPVMPRRPTLSEHRVLIGQLREQHFDLVLNASSNDRSSWLTGLSGAPLRVGRVPRKGRLMHWRLMHNREIEAPYSDRPTWRQKLEALRSAGVPALNLGPPGRPYFHVQAPALEAVDERVRVLDDTLYIHVSPFASADPQGLNIAQVPVMLNALAALRPVVVSIGPTAREARKWEIVARQLHFVPAALFAGDLDTLSFLRLVSRAKLHVGPDSGGVHVARMFGVPTVSWVRRYLSREWISDDPNSHAFVSDEHTGDGVADVSGDAIVEAAVRCLSAP